MPRDEATAPIDREELLELLSGSDVQRITAVLPRDTLVELLAAEPVQLPPLPDEPELTITFHTPQRRLPRVTTVVPDWMVSSWIVIATSCVATLLVGIVMLAFV
jgi:hypothetical protein